MADILIIRKPGRPYASFKVLRVCQTTGEGERQIGRRESENLIVSVKAGNAAGEKEVTHGSAL